MSAFSAEQEQELRDKFLKDTQLFYGPEKEMMEDHRLSPITKRETEAIATVSPDVTSMVRSKLHAATNEAFEMLEQIGAAPGAKWGDLVCGIYTRSGDLSVVSSGGVLIFAACSQYAVKYINKYWLNDPTVGVEPGDVFFYNDARYGGVHNPDHFIVLPVFHQGELISWIVTVVHEGENGAIEPGGMPSAAETVYDMGLMVSPMKIGRNYKLHRDIVTFFQNSVREPKLMITDLKSKLFAAIRVQKRIEETIAEYGVDAIVATLRKTLDDTAAEVRRRLEQWPDGTVRAQSIADGTLRENILIKTSLAMTKKGDQLTLDFRGSAPAFLNRPNNTVLGAMKGMLAQMFLSFIWPDLPRNQAVIDPMQFVVDDNSIYHSSHDTPNSQSMMTFFPAFTVGQMCAAKFLYNSPEKYTKVISSWYNMITTCIYGGVTQYGEMVGNLAADLNAMSGGARDGLDGEHAIAPIFAAMAEQGEQELVEEEVPLMQLGRRIMRDNQGFGKYRSGQGYSMIYTHKDSPAWGYMFTTIGSKYPTAYGLFGGYATPTHPLCKVKGVNVFEVMKANPDLMEYTIEDIMNKRPFAGATYSTHHKGLQFEMAPEGELYMVTQGAGGGYGDVLERSPELVIKDLEENLISDYVARHIYHVIYDEKTLAVDIKATEQSRRNERAARKKRGIPFAEFIRKHVHDVPPAELPFYGTWRDDRVVHAGGPSQTMATGALELVTMPDPKDVRIAELEAKIKELTQS